MPTQKNIEFDRPGGYATPTGAAVVQRRAARELAEADIRLFGDRVPAHRADETAASAAPVPAHAADDPDTRLYVGDCRDILPALPDRGSVDLVFADPPFNWEVPYESWKDGMPRDHYERFTFDWLDACVECLAPHGSIWVNIPDDTAAEIVMHLKRRGLTMVNWCIWHFRFGQHRESAFISSKVHALYFAKDASARRWNPEAILEPSDRASVYADPRTMAKDENKGLRVPMDVWYGPFWGRVQGNNSERRSLHHNQLPEAYLERIILACSNEGDLVLDPFCGSGTTSTVARAWKRRSITTEHSAANAASAWERIFGVGMRRKGVAAAGTAAATTAKGNPRRAAASLFAAEEGE
ncbi:MAG TPA: DNA methyltransferase [Phycisphaerales bacterium]|nr:DNA methyltransferase [Phycisphaerales bacterium]HMP36171.1 DNA methyltransferase [Phycisphaerales bacterium]